jgi:FMN-dependent oxidoreductase (nitrilotriacetate monooxygenase family)
MRQMKLGLFFAPGGHHLAAWRHPEAYPHGFDIQAYVDFAQMAERACFDMVFVADVFSLTPDGFHRDTLRFEPITLLSALAMVTRHIGLAATATTTYNEPYNVARKFASLDQISHGRAAWNIVTSSSSLEAYNFGYDAHPDLANRYRTAHEFVEVVRGLWDSWDEGAMLIDKQGARFFDPQKLHLLNHVGERYRVRGPLTIPRSPQGHPVLVQAGSSDEGKTLAAGVAEVIFTIQRDLAGARAFYSDIKSRVAACGRDPGQALVMPGVMPIIGRTRQEARDTYEQLQALIHPDAGLNALSRTFGMDFSGVDVDGPLPDVDAAGLTQSRATGILETARREGMTVRQVYEKLVVSKGHRQVIGTPADIADTLQEWFEQGGADGYNVMPAHMPRGLSDFAEFVVPELQRRGLFRTAYEGRTLRDHLGLTVPSGRHAQAKGMAAELGGQGAVSARPRRSACRPDRRGARCRRGISGTGRGAPRLRHRCRSAWAPAPCSDA